MKKCQYCTGDNSNNAGLCAYCGRPFPKPQPTKRKPLSTATILVIIVISLVCFWGIFLLVWPREPASVSPSQSAWYACRTFTEDRLKSPLTAKFERYNEDKVTQFNSVEWVVHLNVDSKNSFGAMMRSNIECRVRSEGENWRLITFKEN